jgi:hypothetical protein
VQLSPSSQQVLFGETPPPLIVCTLCARAELERNPGIRISETPGSDREHLAVQALAERN